MDIYSNSTSQLFLICLFVFFTSCASSFCDREGPCSYHFYSGREDAFRDYYYCDIVQQRCMNCAAVCHPNKVQIEPIHFCQEKCFKFLQDLALSGVDGDETSTTSQPYRNETTPALTQDNIGSPLILILITIMFIATVTIGFIIRLCLRPSWKNIKAAKSHYNKKIANTNPMCGTEKHLEHGMGSENLQTVTEEVSCKRHAPSNDDHRKSLLVETRSHTMENDGKPTHYKLTHVPSAIGVDTMAHIQTPPCAMWSLEDISVQCPCVQNKTVVCANICSEQQCGASNKRGDDSLPRNRSTKGLHRETSTNRSTTHCTGHRIHGVKPKGQLSRKRTVGTDTGDLPCLPIRKITNLLIKKSHSQVSSTDINTQISRIANHSQRYAAQRVSKGPVTSQLHPTDAESEEYTSDFDVFGNENQKAENESFFPTSRPLLHTHRIESPRDTSGLVIKPARVNTPALICEQVPKQMSEQVPAQMTDRISTQVPVEVQTSILVPYRSSARPPAHVQEAPAQSLCAEAEERLAYAVQPDQGNHYDGCREETLLKRPYSTLNETGSIMGEETRLKQPHYTVYVEDNTPEEETCLKQPHSTVYVKDTTPEEVEDRVVIVMQPTISLDLRSQDGFFPSQSNKSENSYPVGRQPMNSSQFGNRGKNHLVLANQSVSQSYEPRKGPPDLS